MNDFRSRYRYEGADTASAPLRSGGGSFRDRYKYSSTGVAPEAEVSAARITPTDPGPSPRRAGSGVLGQAWQGIKETGYAVAEGFGRMLGEETRIPDIRAPIDVNAPLRAQSTTVGRNLEELQANRLADQQRVGAPDSTGETVARVGGRVASEIGSFFIPGAQQQKFERAARAARSSTRTADTILEKMFNPERFGGRVATNTAFGAPLTAAIAAGSPEASAVGGIAEITDNDFLRDVASTKGGRIAADLLLDTVGGGVVEGGISAYRGVKGGFGIADDFAAGLSEGARDMGRLDRDAIAPNETSPMVPKRPLVETGPALPPVFEQPRANVPLQPAPMSAAEVALRRLEAIEAEDLRASREAAAAEQQATLVGPSAILPVNPPSPAREPLVLPSAAPEVKPLILPRSVTAPVPTYADEAARAARVPDEDVFVGRPTGVVTEPMSRPRQLPAPASAVEAAPVAEQLPLSAATDDLAPTRTDPITKEPLYQKTRGGAKALTDKGLLNRLATNIRTQMLAAARADAFAGKGGRMKRDYADGETAIGTVGTGVGSGQRGLDTQQTARTQAYEDELRARGVAVPSVEAIVRETPISEVPERLRPEFGSLDKMDEADLFERLGKAEEHAATTGRGDPVAQFRRAMLAGEVEKRGLSVDEGFDDLPAGGLADADADAWLDEFMGTGTPKAERITNSAIRTADGRVFEGADHIAAADNAFAAGAITDPDTYINEAAAGYVTAGGRFVDRDEGLRIARASKQVPDSQKLVDPNSGLASEDLRRADPRAGFASREALQGVVGAGVGALGGAAVDDEKPLRGAAWGAMAGVAGVAGLRNAVEAASGVNKTAVKLPDDVAKAYESAKGRIDYSGDLLKKERADTSPLSTRFDRQMDKLGNIRGPLERLGRMAGDKLAPSRNVRDVLTHLRNVPATVQRAFYEGVIDPNTRKVVGPSLSSVMEPFKGDVEAHEQFFTWVVQERLLGRGLSGFGGNQQQYDEALKVASYFRTVPEMARARDALKQYVDSLGEYAVGTGLWTKPQWDAIRESDVLYIPTKRIREIVGGGGGRSSSDKAMNVASGVQKFTGSDRDIYDPATSIAEYTSEIINRAESYRIGALTIEAVDKLGDVGRLLLTPVPRQGGNQTVRKARAAKEAQGLEANIPDEAMDLISDIGTHNIDPKNPVIWRNGPNGREEYLVNSPDLLQALSGLQEMPSEGMRKLLDTVLLPMKRTFTALTTGIVPAFSLITNPLRDIPETMIKSESNVRLTEIGRGFAHSIGGVVGASKFQKQMRDFGMGNVSLWHDANTTSVGAMKHEIVPTTKGQKWKGKIRKGALRYSGITLLEAAGNATEAGSRLGQAIASMRKNQHKVDSGEWTEYDLLLRAGTEARETIDFSNRPGYAVLRDLARYVPFFSAATNASTTMARAAKRNPKRVAGAVAGYAVASAVVWALKHRSEEVLQRENDRLPSERAGFLFIPLDDAGKFTVRVPLPQEMGIVSAGVTAGLDGMLDEDPKGAQVLIQAINRALPPGVGDLMLEGNVTLPVPGAQQLLENARNRRDYDNAPIVPQSMEGLPAGERRRDSTPYTADLLAAGVRKVGRALPGEGSRLEDVSPLQAENVMRGVTSRFTPFITAATDPIAQRVLGRGEAPPRIPAAMSRNPLNPASAVLANPNPSTTASEQRFYSTRERVMEGEAAIRRAIKQKDRALAERTIADYGEYLDPNVRKAVHDAYSQVQRMNDAADLVRSAFDRGEIDGAKARELLNKIETRAAGIFRSADSVIAQTQRGAEDEGGRNAP